MFPSRKPLKRIIIIMHLAFKTRNFRNETRDKNIIIHVKRYRI